MEERPWTLERFVCALLEHAGGAAEEVEPGVRDALGAGSAPWPRPGEVGRMVFDPEALPEHPDAAPVFFGSPRADDFLEAGKALAPAARAWRADLHPAVHDLKARVRRALSAPETSIEVGPGRARYDALALFLFRVSYLGEEREEELFAAGVDLALGRPHRTVGDWVDSGGWSDRRPLALPDGPMIPLGRALASAWKEIEPHAVSGLRARESDARRRAAVEVARLREYFDESLTELDARRAEAPPVEAASWDERRRATTAERDRRAAEAEARARVRLSAEPVSVLLACVPRIAAGFRLRGKIAVSAPVTVLFDAASHSVLPPDCPACGRPTLEWRLIPPPVGAALGTEATATCPACAGLAQETRERRVGKRRG